MRVYISQLSVARPPHRQHCPWQPISGLTPAPPCCLQHQIAAVRPQTQISAIEEINDIFQIPPQTARNLLHHFNWDKERLVERYYGGNVDKVVFGSGLMLTTSSVCHVTVPPEIRRVPCSS